MSPRRFLNALLLPLFLFSALTALAQTNFATIAPDGAWTWFNDPRALYHNRILYVGYVRSDGKSALSSFNPSTGATETLWTSTWTQKDDHNNPGLLKLEDGRLLAIYAHHGSVNYFSYRTSLSTNPVAAADWGAEQTFVSSANVTYANPFQLSAESGRIYNFMRNLNFNPTVTTSTNAGTSWSAPKIVIQTGTGGVRPYVKYASDYSNRVDFLYTDGHPRNQNNSLYHFFYQTNALHQTDGSFLKKFSDIPLLHDSGEHGTVIYQYSGAPSSDPNDHIATGRAWCSEIAYQANGAPVCVFTVQRDGVTGTNWFDDRIYYYYARWTGSAWQKRFIAHAGRPLYASEDDYSGGICIDPQNPNVIYISSNAADPFKLSDIANVPLRSNERYELFRGTTSDGGLTFSWTMVTTNSTKDNLRPYIPRHGTSPSVIWFSGNYATYTSYQAAIVGLFSAPIPKPPKVKIIKPTASLILMTNSSNKLVLSADVSDDGIPAPLDIEWRTVSGPTNVFFSEETSTNTTARFPLDGTYLLEIAASDTVSTSTAQISVRVGALEPDRSDTTRVLWLKLDESSGLNGADASGNDHFATLSGDTIWREADGQHAGALEFDGVSGVATVADADLLDNTSAFSLSYWFRANGYSEDSAGLISKRDGAGSNNAYTTYLKTADRRIYVDVDGSNNRFSSSTMIDLNAWYHVTLIFDGALPASQRVALWINGKLDVIASETSASLPNYPSHLRLGNTHADAPNWFNGLIDEVRFYRRALSVDEIQTLAQTNIAPSVQFHPAPLAISHVQTFLNGAVTDDGNGGPFSTTWKKIAGPGDVAFTDATNPSTGVMFVRAGSYSLRLSASDSVVTVCDDLLVNVSPNLNFFEDWIAQFYSDSADVAIIGTDADPDGDGIKNLVEFALGMSPDVFSTSPFSPGQAGLPVGTILNVNGTNYLGLRAQRPVNRGGVSYLTDSSSGFTNWVNGLQASVVSNGDGTEVVTFRDTLAIDESSSRFLRLNISRP